MEGKKKHSTFMKEIRELEKRLLNVEREHNKLIRLRNIYAKSASSTRPYLAERIFAKTRPETAPVAMKRLNKHRSNVPESNYQDVNSSGFVPREGVSLAEEVTPNSKSLARLREVELDSGREVEKRAHFNKQVDGTEKHPVSGVGLIQRRKGRSTSSKANLCKSLQNSGREIDGRDRVHFNTQVDKYGTEKRPVSEVGLIQGRGGRPTSSRASFHSTGRDSSARSANSRTSTTSRIPKHGHETWVYKPMPLRPEEQSIYTMIIPPVRSAEDSRKRRLKKNKETTRRHRVPWTDIHGQEHVVRFQGVPRSVYTIHSYENPEKLKSEFEQLRHCRYIRGPVFCS